jgi:Flp pilus assembly protein TadG
MKRDNRTLFRRLWKDRRGFALAMVGVAMVGLTGMGALSVDLSYVYFAQSQLQATANAAALAGGAVLWEVNTNQPGETSSSQAVTAATTYSGVSSDKNAMAAGYSVAMASGYPKLLCLTSTGAACSTSASPPTYNAIEVQETATVGLIFARIFGFDSVKLSATAMAGAVCPGGCGLLSQPPYNIMLIVDSTQSMATATNPYCTISGISNPSMFQCALVGGQTLLKQLNATQDFVGLMTFPGLSSSTYVPYEYCGGSSKTLTVPSGTCSVSTSCSSGNCNTGTSTNCTGGIEMYGNGTSNSPPYYEIIGTATTLDKTYSTTAGTLVATDPLVQALSVNKSPGTCDNTSQLSGLEDVGGAGTYYAGVITQAQTILTSVNATRNLPPNHNVIILLSDGDATASSSSGQINAAEGTGECKAAITAAQKATAAGMIVVAVAYGTETSGCTTDSAPYNNPCYTMQNIASSPLYFYSEDTAAKNGCVSADHPSLTSLSQIFGGGAGTITTQLGLQPVRLLAAGTT